VRGTAWRRRVLRKDPSKVDRSAAYASRYVAKNIVAAGLASKCLVQISYAIGVSKPTSVMVDTYGTGKISNEKMTALVLRHLITPQGIVQMLNLLRRFIRILRHTDTLDARNRTLPGRAPTRRRRCVPMLAKSAPCIDFQPSTYKHATVCFGH